MFRKEFNGHKDDDFNALLTIHYGEDVKGLNDLKVKTTILKHVEYS